MKKLKLLILCLVFGIVFAQIHDMVFKPASAQNFPQFESLTEPDDAEASSGEKFSKPNADTRVTESDAKVNYGKSKYLAAGRWKKGRVESYLKFKTRKGYRPSKLHIYLVNGKTSGLSVYSASRNWNEKKVTWKNRPSKGELLDSSASKSGSWWEFDVSEAQSNGGEYAFAITGSSSNVVNIYSREGKRAPRLSFVKGNEKTPKPTNKPGKTSNPDATPKNTPKPTSSNPNPTPVCDPGIDCEDDGESNPGLIEIDESDDGAGTDANCSTSLDCEDDGNPAPTPTNRTNNPNPTCPSGIDCTPDNTPNGGKTPAPTPTSTGCAPGIDCSNDGPPRTTSPAPTNVGSSGTVAPPPNTKIAFVGDTGDGNDFQAVLNMIKAEGAQAVIHSGDLSYTNSATTFINKINATLGPNFPYFMGQGNHDTGTKWAGYVPRIPSQYVIAGTPESANYAVNWNNIYIAFGKSKISTPSTYSSDLKLAQAQNIWKICSFHEVHRAMHTGYKKTEIPFSVYDECRTYGAMTTNGHAHTYSRTVTLLSAAGQQKDPAYPDPFVLGLGRGAFFDFHTGVSGHGTGQWQRCRRTTDASEDGKCDIFANRNGAVITREGDPYGAGFITFNVGGDPRKAVGYYKETGSTTNIDDFTITAQ